jgi:hypothetical protein
MMTPDQTATGYWCVERCTGGIGTRIACLAEGRLLLLKLLRGGDYIRPPWLPTCANHGIGPRDNPLPGSGERAADEPSAKNTPVNLLSSCDRVSVNKIP